MAANRTARSIRSLSSAKRSRASPIARICRPARSSCPPTKSITRPSDRLVEQPVDGEVAARGVLLGGAEGDAVGVPAVAVGGVAAERGHLDRAGRLRPEHGNHAEGGADGHRAAVAEQLADLGGRGAGGHVVVLGRPPEQLVADAAAGPIGLEPRRLQSADHLLGKTALFIGNQHTQSRDRSVAPQSRDRWSRHKAAIADRATKPRPFCRADKAAIADRAAKPRPFVAPTVGATNGRGFMPETTD